MQLNKFGTRPPQRLPMRRIASADWAPHSLVVDRNALNQNVFEFVPAPQSQLVKSRARWCPGASKILAIRDWLSKVWLCKAWISGGRFWAEGSDDAASRENQHRPCHARGRGGRRSDGREPCTCLVGVPRRRARWRRGPGS